MLFFFIATSQTKATTIFCHHLFLNQKHLTGLPTSNLPSANSLSHVISLIKAFQFFFSYTQNNIEIISHSCRSSIMQQLPISYWIFFSLFIHCNLASLVFFQVSLTSIYSVLRLFVIFFHSSSHMNSFSSSSYQLNCYLIRDTLLNHPMQIIPHSIYYSSLLLVFLVTLTVFNCLI